MRESEEREVERGECARANSTKKKGFFYHLDNITTLYFINNFHDEVTTGELWKLFQKFGKVGEVYIPKKLDKKGRRFGFVKFKEVHEVEKLSESLSDVWIGSFKLWINRSRFQRADNNGGNSQKQPESRPTMSL
ncbi:hypothetical protein P8452_53215 [Trifolium repens]|jgi:RNA recognition motif-containing protein|nr:hypothetical protein QL285_034546 [Trifolium repens]WJX68889.1 hypothetical protein P8452_53215 [Trifolium repens]